MTNGPQLIKYGLDITEYNFVRVKYFVGKGENAGNQKFMGVGK